MLLAIDVGNTQAVFGLWDGAAWRAVWRRATSADETEDQLAVWLKGLFELSGLSFEANGVIVASVVPQMNFAIDHMARKWLGVTPAFLRTGSDVGLQVDYDPPHAVGADRLANALAALARYEPPIIVVDFGTATTFDAVSKDGHYAGGAILAGIEVATQALIGRTAKLPQFELRVPDKAVGTTTTGSLQAGMMLGYAGAIDHLAEKMSAELGGNATVVATGGLGALFLGVSKSISEYLPNLTLDGLVIAYRRLTKA
jgi:type III pantothenate kinase